MAVAPDATPFAGCGVLYVATGEKYRLEAARSARSLKAAMAELPALLASAPHRMMFFAGASAVIVSMLWWACFLGAGYFGHAFPAAPVPAESKSLLKAPDMSPLIKFLRR